MWISGLDLTLTLNYIYVVSWQWNPFAPTRGHAKPIDKLTASIMSINLIRNQCWTSKALALEYQGYGYLLAATPQNAHRIFSYINPNGLCRAINMFDKIQVYCFSLCVCVCVLEWTLSPFNKRALRITADNKRRHSTINRNSTTDRTESIYIYNTENQSRRAALSPARTHQHPHKGFLCKYWLLYICIEDGWRGQTFAPRTSPHIDCTL